MEKAKEIAFNFLMEERIHSKEDKKAVAMQNIIKLLLIQTPFHA